MNSEIRPAHFNRRSTVKIKRRFGMASPVTLDGALVAEELIDRVDYHVDVALSIHFDRKLGPVQVDAHPFGFAERQVDGLAVVVYVSFEPFGRRDLSGICRRTARPFRR